MRKKRSLLVNILCCSFLVLSSGCLASRTLPFKEASGRVAEVVPSPSEFQEADANSDNVIDKNESAHFAAQQASSRPLSAFWVMGAILALALIICVCTPTPAGLIKTKVSGAAETVRSKCSGGWCWVRKKFSKKS